MDYRITSLAMALAAALIIIRLIRGNLLHAGYAAWWLAGATAIFLAGAFPEAVNTIGHALGVSYPPTFFLVLAVIALAIRLLAADIARTRMELTLRRLVQRNAELSMELKRLSRDLDHLAGEDPGDSPPPQA
jgi:hypothetical protein